MMDRAAQDFKSLTAAFEHIKYTAVVSDTSTESGEIFVRKDSKMRIDFQFTLNGEEELDGHKVVVLDLVPNSPEVRKQIERIRIWVDQSSWLPVQQKFFETGSGDYFISRYTKVMKNLKLGDGKFKPDWPKGTKVEKHG